MAAMQAVTYSSLSKKSRTSISRQPPKSLE
jgi:hypothetical protein